MNIFQNQNTIGLFFSKPTFEYQEKYDILIYQKLNEKNRNLKHTVSGLMINQQYIFKFIFKHKIYSHFVMLFLNIPQYHSFLPVDH